MMWNISSKKTMCNLASRAGRQADVRVSRPAPIPALSYISKASLNCFFLYNSLPSKGHVVKINIETIYR